MFTPPGRSRDRARRGPSALRRGYRGVGGVTGAPVGWAPPDAGGRLAGGPAGTPAGLPSGCDVGAPVGCDVGEPVGCDVGAPVGCEAEAAAAAAWFWRAALAAWASR